MTGLQRFSSHSMSLFNFCRPFISKLHRHRLCVKKNLISTDNAVLQLSNFSNLDISQRKTHSQNPVPDKNVLKTFTEYSKIEASQVPQIKKSVQDERNISVAKEVSVESISILLDESPLSRDKAIEISFKIRKMLRQHNASNNEVMEFMNGEKIQYLMTVLEKYLHTMHPKEVKIVFEVCLLSKINISPIFMQKILLMIIKSINSYSAIDVLFLYEGAMQLDNKIKYVESLNFVCYTYMKNCFVDKLEGNYKLESVPFFFQKQTMPHFIRMHFKNIINDCHLQIFSSQQIMYIMKGIKLCAQNSYVDPVFNKKVQEALKNLNLNTSSPRTLSNLAILYILGVFYKLYEYDEEMCNIFASTPVWTSNKLNLYNNCKIMEYLCKIGHLNTFFRRFIFQQCKTSSFEWSISETLLKIISHTGLSQLDEDTQHFFINKFKVLNFPDISIRNPKNTSLDNLLKVNLGLAVMGIYKKEIVDESFDLITQKCSNLYSSELFTLWGILLLHQWVSVLHPSHENKLREDVVDDCYSLFVKKLDSSCSEKVITDTFGENYVLTGWETPLKHIPSCVVVLETGNKPLDLSSYKTNKVPVNFETIPANSKIVLIQEVPKAMNWEFVNVQVLQGHSQLYVQILERLGYDVIILKESQFNDSCAPANRKDFLISEIEKKFGKIDFEK